MKARRGRPAIAASERRKKTIYVHLTDSELRIVQQVSGWDERPVSSWARRAIVEAAMRIIKERGKG